MMGRFPKHGTGGKCHRDRPLSACANTAEIGSLMLYFPIDHPHFCGAFSIGAILSPLYEKGKCPAAATMVAGMRTRQSR